MGGARKAGTMGEGGLEASFSFSADGTMYCLLGLGKGYTQGLRCRAAHKKQTKYRMQKK